MNFYSRINTITFPYRAGTSPTRYRPFPPIYPTVTIHAKIKFVTKRRSRDGNIRSSYSEVLKLKIWPEFRKSSVDFPSSCKRILGLVRQIEL